MPKALFRASCFSLLLASGAALAATGDCDQIKRRFYSVRDVQGLLTLPFGITKSPEDLTQRDYEDIGKKVFECGNNTPSFSAGSISSKMSSIRRKLRPVQKTERVEPNLGGTAAPKPAPKSERLSHLEENSERQKAMNFLIYLRRYLKGEIGATSPADFKEDSVENAIELGKKYPDMSLYVEEIQALQKKKKDNYEAFRQRQTAAADAKNEKDAKFSLFLKNVFGESGPAECSQAEAARKKLGDTNGLVQRASQLSLAGETAAACQIISGIKDKFKMVRASLVACAKAVAASDEELASEASSKILGDAALVNFLGSQTLRPVDDVQCR